MLTTLNVTGKPAQFGRGVMAEVSGKLIGIFADNLAAMLAESNSPAGTAPAASPAGSAPDGSPATDAHSNPAGAPVVATPVVAPSSADTADVSAAATPSGPAGTPSAGPSATAVKVPVRHSDEQLNLLKVAGLPLLKRVFPVLLGLIAAVLIALRKRIFRRAR